MKKIGIITIHSDLHYGAALQAFALNRVLSKKYKSEIIDYRKIPTNLPHFGFIKMRIYELMSIIRTKRYRKFLSSELSMKRYNSLDELMNNFNEDYDVIVTGSDQVWNPAVGGLGKLNPAYFAAFADSSKYKKISYASSVGNYIYPEDEKITIKTWLSEYSHLSTRESFGKTQLEGILNKKVDLVIDPTLLLTKEDWIKVSHKVSIKDKYVLVYNVGSKVEKDAEYARKIADKNGWKVVYKSIRLKKDKYIDKNIPNCGPAEFLWLFANAEFIVTSSFHGVAFSLNLEKNFLNVYNPKSPQRVQHLLESVGLEDRILNSIDQLINFQLNIDYSSANIKLEKLRQNSLMYLFNAIEN